MYDQTPADNRVRGLMVLLIHLDLTGYHKVLGKRGLHRKLVTHWKAKELQ